LGGFCFVHAADLHLDSPFASLKAGSPRLAQAFIDASRASLQALAGVCIERGADFLVLAGDVFDAEQQSIRAQFELFEALSERVCCSAHPAFRG
jgi:exonuclease SbcD